MLVGGYRGSFKRPLSRSDKLSAIPPKLGGSEAYFSTRARHVPCHQNPALLDFANIAGVQHDRNGLALGLARHDIGPSSEERRGGNEGVRTGSSRWSTNHTK